MIKHDKAKAAIAARCMWYEVDNDETARNQRHKLENLRDYLWGNEGEHYSEEAFDNAVIAFQDWKWKKCVEQAAGGPVEMKAAVGTVPESWFRRAENNHNARREAAEWEKYKAEWKPVIVRLQDIQGA